MEWKVTKENWNENNIESAVVSMNLKSKPTQIETLWITKWSVIKRTLMIKLTVLLRQIQTLF